MDEILKAINIFENAVSRAWSLDTEDSFTDKDRKLTREAHANVVIKKQELIDLIMRKVEVL